MDRGTWQATVYGVTESQTWLREHACTQDWVCLSHGMSNFLTPCGRMSILNYSFCKNKESACFQGCAPLPGVSHPLVARRAELMDLGGEWAPDHGSTSPVLCPTEKTHAGSSWCWPWPSNWEFADVILYSKTFQTIGCKPYFMLCRLENQ